MPLHRHELPLGGPPRAVENRLEEPAPARQGGARGRPGTWKGRDRSSVSRVWHSDTLVDAETKVSAKGSKDKPLSSLGWDDNLATFRPFLSYNELGSLLDEGPSKLYDALSSVLGLDELTAVQTRLANARKARETMVVSAKNGAKELAQRIAAVETNDERFGKALLGLGAKTGTWPRSQGLIVADDAPEERRQPGFVGSPASRLLTSGRSRPWWKSCVRPSAPSRKWPEPTRPRPSARRLLDPR